MTKTRFQKLFINSDNRYKILGPLESYKTVIKLYLINGCTVNRFLKKINNEVLSDEFCNSITSDI